ncbi:MAG: hypothetical protein ACP5SH_06460 [Syntrophobacteraceae bacterium]
MKKEKVADTNALFYANLAILAEREGDYENAGKQWHNASEASVKPDSKLLYAQAAMRCEKKAREKITG